MKKILMTLCLVAGLSGLSLAQISSRLMVIPSDDLLKRLDCLTEKKVQGETVYERNYQKAYIDQIDLRFVCSAIADKFNKANFQPLDDFEQSLKNLQDDAILDDLMGVQTDARTQVLNRVRPDVILELSYLLQEGAGTNRLTFSLVAKDAYTSKVLATIANPGMKTLETDVPTLLAEQVQNTLSNFTAALEKHAEDVRINGRTIRLLVAVDGNASFDLEDECGTTGEAFIDVLMDVVEGRKKKGSETPNLGNTTTGKRMQVSNIRIDYIDPVKNRGVSARDWVRYVVTDIQKTCGVKAKNLSQGIGEGRIILSDK